MWKLNAFLELITALLRVERQAAVCQALGTPCCNTTNAETWKSSRWTSLFSTSSTEHQLTTLQNIRTWHLIDVELKRRKRKRKKMMKEDHETKSSTKSEDMEEMWKRTNAKGKCCQTNIRSNVKSLSTISVEIG